MIIKTNNQPRPFLWWWDLTEKEKAEFDYLETDQQRGEAYFLRYKGNVYDVGEFTRCDHIEGWEGITAHTAFSATLLRVCDNNEYAILGSYYQ